MNAKGFLQVAVMSINTRLALLDRQFGLQRNPYKREYKRSNTPKYKVALLLHRGDLVTEEMLTEDIWLLLVPTVKQLNSATK